MADAASGAWADPISDIDRAEAAAARWDEVTAGANQITWR